MITPRMPRWPMLRDPEYRVPRSTIEKIARYCDTFERLLAAVKFQGACDETESELFDIWCTAMRGGARAILDELVRIYPKVISRTELGERLNLRPYGSTFRTSLKALERSGVVKIEGSYLRAGPAVRDRARQ